MMTFLTEEQANELLRNKTPEEIKELIFGFNKRLQKDSRTLHQIGGGVADHKSILNGVQTK